MLGAFAPTHAFTFSSSDPGQKGWAARPLVFYINRSNCPANIDALLARAVKLWNSIPESSLQIAIGEDSSESTQMLLDQTATKVPLIVCDSDFSASLDVDGDSVHGVGFVAGTVRPIHYGGLILNAEAAADGRIGALDENIAALVVAHEIGHALGIGHSSDAAALMYFNVAEKIYLNFSQDDIDAAVFLYPRNELSHPDWIGGCGALAAAAGQGGGQGPGGGNSLMLFAAMYAAFAAWRRRPHLR